MQQQQLYCSVGGTRLANPVKSEPAPETRRTCTAVSACAAGGYEYAQPTVTSDRVCKSKVADATATVPGTEWMRRVYMFNIYQRKEFDAILWQCVAYVCGAPACNLKRVQTVQHEVAQHVKYPTVSRQNYRVLTARRALFNLHSTLDN